MYSISVTRSSPNTSARYSDRLAPGYSGSPRISAIPSSTDRLGRREPGSMESVRTMLRTTLTTPMSAKAQTTKLVARRASTNTRASTARRRRFRHTRWCKAFMLASSLALSPRVAVQTRSPRSRRGRSVRAGPLGAGTPRSEWASPPRRVDAPDRQPSGSVRFSQSVGYRTASGRFFRPPSHPTCDEAPARALAILPATGLAGHRPARAARQPGAGADPGAGAGVALPALLARALEQAQVRARVRVHRGHDHARDRGGADLAGAVAGARRRALDHPLPDPDQGAGGARLPVPLDRARPRPRREPAPGDRARVRRDPRLHGARESRPDERATAARARAPLGHAGRARRRAERAQHGSGSARAPELGRRGFHARRPAPARHRGLRLQRHARARPRSRRSGRPATDAPGEGPARQLDQRRRGEQPRLRAVTKTSRGPGTPGSSLALPPYVPAERSDGTAGGEGQAGAWRFRVGATAC